MDEILEDIKKIESEQIDYHKLSDDYFRVIEGKIPILISAPHGARHLREGSWIGEDEYTASMAIKLGELTGAHVIYVKNKTIEDPNFEEVSKYKIAIKQIIEKEHIKFVADIHGAKKKQPFNICVGTISDKDPSCPTYLSIIEKVLEDVQKTDLFNRKNFTAGNQETITKFSRKLCNIESAQFEINANYRIIERKPDSSKAIEGDDPHFKAEEKDALKMVKLMEKLIKEISEKMVRKE